jgi:hypothetical protein
MLFSMMCPISCCLLPSSPSKMTDSIASIEEQGFFLINEDGHEYTQRVADVINIGFELVNRLRHKPFPGMF